MKLTKEQAVTLSIYTGALLCELEDVQEYTKGIIGRPMSNNEVRDIFTDKELSDFHKEMKEKVRPDLLKII